MRLSPVRPQFGKLENFRSTGYFGTDADIVHDGEKILDTISSYWQSTSREKRPVIVTFDGSVHASRLLPVFSKGLAERGLKVYTYHDKPWGDLPMPLGMLALFAKKFHLFAESSREVAGAIMLTAGSRPRTMAGMRFINSNGEPFSPNEMAALKEHYGRKPTGVVGGSVEQFNFMKGHYSDQLERVVNMTAIKEAEKHPFFDPRYGASRERFFKDFHPCESRRWGVSSINDRYDKQTQEKRENCPPHITWKNSRSISEFMKRDGTGSIGLINNPDSTQCRVLSEEGILLTPTEAGALLLEHFVERKQRRGVVIKTSDVGRLLDDVAARYGLDVLEVPTGGSFLVEAAKSANHRLLFAMDGQGGFIYPDLPPVKDGHLSNFHFMEMRALSGESGLGGALTTLEKKNPFQYCQTHLQVKTNAPAKLIASFRKMGTHITSSEGLSPDWFRSKRWNEMMQKLYDTYNEVKVWFRDSSTLLIRQQRENLTVFDLFLETAKRTPCQFPFSKSPQKDIVYHANVKEKIKKILKEKLDVQDIKEI